MTKASKIVRTFLLIILTLIILATAACCVNQVTARSGYKKTLEADSFVNMVSAGDYKMNLNLFGNESAEYTVVAMPGGTDTAFPVLMKEFSGHLDDNIRLAVVSRPGYGLTEETKNPVTVEYVVESTRTALDNAGVKAPYILMPHSFSGIYATYWESTYPDEISAVLFLDSVSEADEIMEQPAITSGDKMYSILSSLGITRVWFGENHVSGIIPEKYMADALALENYNDVIGSHSVRSEIYTEYASNMQKAWASISSNEIPKIYITTEPESINDMKDILMFRYSAEEITDEDVKNEFDSYSSDEYNSYRTALNSYINRLGNCETVNIPADHFVYAHKPDETAAQLEKLISRIK